MPCHCPICKDLNDPYSLFNQYKTNKEGNWQSLKLSYLFLNDKVDIPFINEKTEEKVLNAVYEAVEEALKTVLMK